MLGNFYIIMTYFLYLTFRKPELHYFGTNQIGTAKQNLTDLYPYTKKAKTVFNSCNIKKNKLRIALAEADGIVLSRQRF